MKRKYNISVTTITIFFLLSILPACEQKTEQTSRPQPHQPAYEGTIVAVGDSLTAGLGVNEEDAYPAVLEKKLRAAGCNWRVVNAGISGETSSGTLSRVNWVLKLKPDIVILETGANDGLRGIDPGITQKNIAETVRILNENGVRVVLAGMRMVSNMGRNYTDAFAAIYPAVARKQQVRLIPFFLKEVAGEPSLNQADGIHPNAKGYLQVAETVYQEIKQEIDQRGKFGRLKSSRP